MGTNEDPLAALDQARKAIVDISALIFDYYNALTTRGFTEEQALMLTVDYQRQLFGFGRAES